METYDGTMLSNGLDAVLTDYIEKNNKDSVISILFYKSENLVLMDLSHGNDYIYRKYYIDGEFMKQRKHVVYYTLNKNLADSLIIPYCYNDTIVKNKIIAWNIDNSICKEIKENSMFTHYKILSKDKIVEISENDLKTNRRSENYNAIRNPAICKLIKDTLTSNDCTFVSLHFSSFDGMDFFRIKLSNTYDNTEELNGCLIYHNHVILLYSLDKLLNKNIIDRNKLSSKKRILSCYRETPKEDLYYFHFAQSRYKVVSNDSIKQMNTEEDSVYFYRL